MQQKMHLKRIEPKSVAKILGLIYLVLGLVLGVMVSFFGKLGTLYTDMNTSAIYGVVGSYSIIFFPLVYGVMGYVMGLVISVAYNLTSRFTGGVEFTIKLKEQSSKRKLSSKTVNVKKR